MNKSMKMTLFFTEGVSMQIWNKVGMFDREIKPYNILAEKFEKIYFVTYGDEQDLEYKKFLHKNIEILPKKSKLPSKIYSLIVPFIYRRELSSCDVYKTNQMQGSWTALISKMLYGKKLVVRCGYQWSQFSKGWGWGFWKKTMVFIIEKSSYYFADKIVVTAEPDVDYIIKRYNINKNKIVVIPNYVDDEIFKKIDSPKERDLVFVGRLEKQKNLDSLLDALKDTKISLTLVGKGSLEKELKEKVSANGLDVKFIDQVPNDKIPELLNKHKIFILPSFYEGNPKTLLEAMSCEMPVIGANSPGINNIIKNEINGMICEFDSNTIKYAIGILLKDQSLMNKIAKGARKYILDKCSLKVIILKETEVYQNY